MQDFFSERATLLLDTSALIHNYHTLSRFLQKTGKHPRIIAIVKANAYGHGLALAAKAFLDAGCNFFGVATLDEAVTVRKIAPSADILILGYTPPHHASTLAEKHITQTVFSPEYASALATAARNQGIVLPIHVKLDCGMHRLGFDPANPTKIHSAVTEKGLLPTGIYTHFPVADTDAKATLQSLKQFLACRSALCDKGLSLFAHTAASAAPFNLPESVLDGVRPGLALYGISPVPTTLPLRPALSLFAPVVQVHNLPTGTPIGYGGDFITQSPTRVGTVPIGYGDGTLLLLGFTVVLLS